MSDKFIPCGRFERTDTSGTTVITSNSDGGTISFDNNSTKWQWVDSDKEYRPLGAGDTIKVTKLGVVDGKQQWKVDWVTQGVQHTYEQTFP